VLFENDSLQIGVKSEYRQNLGRIGIFYGNKTSFQFTGFIADVTCSGNLSSHILFIIKLRLLMTILKAKVELE
jgi:AP-2 complex subunit alpha